MAEEEGWLRKRGGRGKGVAEEEEGWLRKEEEGFGLSSRQTLCRIS